MKKGFWIFIPLILAFSYLASRALTNTTPSGRERTPQEAGIEVLEGPARSGIWISSEDIADFPMVGNAWRLLKKDADSAAAPNLSDQEDRSNVYTLSKALVYARTGEESYRTEVILACMQAMETENGGRSLALARNLGAFVIAADLVGLPENEDRIFRAWLREVRHENLSGRTLISTHEDRPNNWGTHAGGARAAVAAYLGDGADLARTAQVFKGYLGDRDAYSGFKYGALSWQADPSKPVGINPKGATIQGRNVDGCPPDDQRRGGAFSWPPPKENYSYEAMQGVLMQAAILYRAGYTDVWEWEDRAILRAFTWLHDTVGYPAEGDDTWMLFIINQYYGTDFDTPSTSRFGKNMTRTCWTHP